MPSAAAAAGAGNGNGQASSQPAPDDGVAGGAVSPAAAAAPADGSPEKQSAPESSHPQPSQPSMDVTADADGGKARQVSWLTLPDLACSAWCGHVALWLAVLLAGFGKVYACCLVCMATSLSIPAVDKRSGWLGSKIAR